VSLIHGNDEIQTLAPDRSNEPFAKSVCRGRSNGSPESADTEISQRRIDSLREDSVAVVDHESVWMVVGDQLTELLNRPFRVWVIGHIDMLNLAGANLHRDENVDNAKTNP
jgi:hypothetical protein